MVGRGAVGPFDGDLDDYQRYLLDEAKRQRELAKTEAAAEPALPAAPAVATEKRAESSDGSGAGAQKGLELAAGAVPDAREQRRLTAEARAQRAQQLRPLKREIEQIDQRLAALESERTALQAQLAGQPTPAQMADCGKRLKVGLDETQRLEERWLELSSELEGAAQGS